MRHLAALPAPCALAAALVPSLVAAAPAPSVPPWTAEHTRADEAEPADRVRYGAPDHAPGDPPPPRAGSWIELADRTPTRHGTTHITVDPDALTFRRLRIAAIDGRPRIQRVRIDFDDGSRRVVRLERRLHPRARPTADIDLRGARQITQIVVTAERGDPGAYIVLGEAGAPPQLSRADDAPRTRSRARPGGARPRG